MEAAILDFIKKTYQKANSRVIFIDYDGTLIPFSTYPEQAVMNGKAQKTITNLTNDEKNKVIIISGRNKDFLERQFEKAHVTLIAEHGFFIKELGKGWVTNIATELDWKQKVEPILNEYVNRCKGSFLEEKFASLAWHYRNVESDVAALRMNELKDDLLEVLKNNTDLQVLEGNKVVEIKSRSYNKGTIASDIMQHNAFDFAMAIGDDKTDEDLFRVMPPTAFTIKIGSTISFARYNLKMQNELYDLFQNLTEN
jgi:trehalose 6-phosphate synthase/phosphatase